MLLILIDDVVLHKTHSAADRKPFKIKVTFALRVLTETQNWTFLSASVGELKVMS